MVTEELIDRIYELATNRLRALRIVWVARSSISDLVIDDLADITAPTLLIWGAEDQITPPDVAHMFDRLMPSTQLHFIENCGHAPMMEHPDTFNEIMINFLEHSIDRIALPSQHLSETGPLFLRAPIVLFLGLSALLIAGCSPTLYPLYRDYEHEPGSSALLPSIEEALIEAGWELIPPPAPNAVATADRQIR